MNVRVEIGVGESGANLKRFAKALDAVSASEMIQAIEEGCEQEILSSSATLDPPLQS